MTFCRKILFSLNFRGRWVYTVQETGQYFYRVWHSKQKGVGQIFCRKGLKSTDQPKDSALKGPGDVMAGAIKSCSHVVEG